MRTVNGRRTAVCWTKLVQPRWAPVSRPRLKGGTWSCPGGALDHGETAYEGALREASEEVGFAPPSAVLLGEHVFAPAVDWSYTTVVVQVDEPFGEPLNFETDAIEWLPVDEVDGRSLHPGFASAWPHVRQIVAASTP